MIGMVVAVDGLGRRQLGAPVDDALVPGPPAVAEDPERRRQERGRDVKQL